MSIWGVEAGRAMFAALEAFGVTHVFGLPGTQTVPLFEALRRSRLATVVPTHELAASFMAGAFHRVAGRPAVLLTIPGPGFSYALTGLAEARLDSAALVCLVPAAAEGPEARFGLQAIPQTALAASLAKATLQARSADELPSLMERACALATGGEPGPVVVFLGDDPDACPEPRIANSKADGSDATGTIEHLWARIEAARRPVVFAGQGCQRSAAALREFVERLNAPVLTTTSGRGIVPEDHPLSMAFDTHRGTVPAVNDLLARADLVIVLGARLGHNGTAGHALKFDRDRTLHVDTDPAVLGRVCPPGASACTAVEAFLAEMPRKRVQRSRWSPEELAEAKRAISVPAARPAEPRITGLSAEQFFEELRGVLPRDAIVVTDTGQHQIMVRRYLPVLEPGGLLIPSDFQSMGFGLPAAIAARLAAPQRPVVGMIGDGGLAMSGMELATAAALRLNLPVIVFDDGRLNQIRLAQQSAFGSSFGVDLPPLDFAALAQATGVGFADIGSDVGGALRAALAAPEPTLLRVPVGDSLGTHRVRAAARSRALMRQALGERLVSALRGLRRRG